jgi:hypothetical protein
MKTKSKILKKYAKKNKLKIKKLKVSKVKLSEFIGLPEFSLSRNKE